MSAREIYDSTIRRLPPMERLRLASLILDELALSKSDALDVADDWTEQDVADLEQENFDDRFTPAVLAHLDRISNDMKDGKSVSMEEVDQHLADVRKAWLKDHAS